MRVVGESREPRHAVRDLATLRPDVVVLADVLRGESAIDLLPKLLAAARGMRAVVLSDSHDAEVHRKAVAAGASAVLVYHVPPSELFSARQAPPIAMDAETPQMDPPAPSVAPKRGSRPKRRVAAR